MKKTFIVLAIIVSVLCLTACSEDFTSRLGDVMGRMGNNVYGIRPDLRIAEESAATVRSSITKDGDGKVSIDYTNISSIADTIGEIRESPQKTKALNDLLSAEVPAEDAAGIRESLTEKVAELRTSIGNVSYDDPLSGIKNALINALSVSASDRAPVYSEVVMVSLLDRMVAAVTADGPEDDGVSNVGKKAVDTIKVVAQISTLDILADINVTGLVSSLTGKDISRDGEGVNPVVANLLGKTVSKIVDIISTDGKFDQAKYDKFILQAQMLTAAYEMACSSYIPDEWSVESIMKIGDADIDNGLTIEDLVLYLVLKINNAFETYSGGVWGGVFLKEYMFHEHNYEIFSDFEHATARPESPAAVFSEMLGGIVDTNGIEVSESIDFDDVGADMATEIMDGSANLQETLTVALGAIVGEDFSFSDMLKDFGEVLRGIRTDVTDKARQFATGFRNTVFTCFIMIIDAEYDAVFSFLNSAIEPLTASES